MWKLNWNKERWRTRDRLLEYDNSIMPPLPHSGGIAMPVVYPWENTTLMMLSHQLFGIATENGFTGTEEQFLQRFSRTEDEKQIIMGTIITFPEDGDESVLYLDRESGILYYFKITSAPIDVEAAEQIGAAVVGEGKLYIPVRALLQEDTILNCGDAAEYID